MIRVLSVLAQHTLHKATRLQTRLIMSKPIHEQMADAEKTIQRNPHADFKGVEASRPPLAPNDAGFTYTQTKISDWKFGQAGNDGGKSLHAKLVEIDPYAQGRPAASNYKLLISAIVPRPIGFCSTVSADGELILSYLIHKSS
jgi:hypothetical protein